MGATSLLCGAAFGAAMMTAGFYQPAIVIAQLKFENWAMIQAFLAATASSALFYALIERTGYAPLKPRSSSPLGLFGTYDGNVVGGSLLGAGMAMSGSCPGTLYAQLAAGVHTGFYALNGAILGGILWTGVVSKLVAGTPRSVVKTVAAHEQIGLPRDLTRALLVAACAAVVAVTYLYTPPFPGQKIAAPLGGLAIGLSQLVSLLLRRSMIGVSGAYEEVGTHFWWLLRGAKTDARPRSLASVLFAVGVAAGAWITLAAVPSLASVPALEVKPALAALGGVLMAVGSRMAGGCTSGHGISGISLLSVSSIITIASAFAMGGIVAPLVH